MMLPRMILAIVFAAVAALFIVPFASAAPAEFGVTGAEQTYTVPAGATGLSVEAVGSKGGDTGFLLGGKGAAVTGRVDADPGQTLYVEVGGATCNGAASGGFGLGGSGGAGGGATDLRTISASDGGGGFCGTQSNASLGSRLIVAAGGGGAGVSGGPPGPPAPSGGDAGEDGAGGGGAGTATAGGAGSGTGASGGLGFGGAGDPSCCLFYGGGGGGSGLYGGGAGGNGGGGGGGGGGGSSVVPHGGTFEVTADPPSMTITALFPVTVDFSGNGAGTVTSTPGGIDCPSSPPDDPGCKTDVADGDAIELEAQPAPGSSFAGWEGGGCSGSSPTCEVPVAGATNITASFSDDPPVISDLRMVPNSFAASGKTTPLERAKGAKIKLRLSEDATVRFRIRRDPPVTGSPPPVNPRIFKRQLEAGTNSVPFSGKLGELIVFKPNRYRLTARARDSLGQPSERVTTTFRIVP